MTLRLNGSTSGYVEIDAPAVAGSTAITIPATTGGEFIVSDSAGDVNLDNGTFFVDASTNRVGIGTTTPGDLNANANNLVVGSGSGSEGITIYSGTTGNSNIHFADGTGADAYAGYIQFSHISDTMKFGIQGQDAVYIDSSRRLLVGTPTSLRSTAFIQSRTSSGASETWHESGDLGNGNFCRGIFVSGGRSGQVGVHKHSGITNPAGMLYLQEEDGNDSWFWTDNSGNFRISSLSTNIGTTGGTVVGTQTSDERLKNVGGNVSYGLNEVLQLQPKQYALKTEPDTNKLGFIAQEVESIIPEAVFDTNEELEGHQEGDRTRLGMEYVQLIPVLVNAIKEQQATITDLQTRLAALEASLTALEGGAS